MLHQFINPIIFSLCLIIFIMSCSAIKNPNLIKDEILMPSQDEEQRYKAVGLGKKSVQRNYHERYRSHPSLRLTK